MSRRHRAILAALVGVGLAGCYRDHGGGARPESDDASVGPPDDASEAAPDGRAPDSGDDCIANVEAPTSCEAHWIRGFGADGIGNVYWSTVDVDEDGRVFALLGAPSGNRLTLGGTEIVSYGGRIAVALSPGGDVLWARRGLGQELLAASSGEVIVADGDEAQYLRADDGELREAVAVGESVDWAGAAFDSCVEGCGRRDVRVARWRDSIDLGPLGTVEAPAGLSIVYSEDSVQTRHWTTRLPEVPVVGSTRAQRSVGGDPTTTLALYHGRSPHTGEPLCLPGLPCVEQEHSLVLRIGEGQPPTAWTIPDGRVWSMAMLDEDELLVGVNHGFIRYSATGERLRASLGSLGPWTGRFALSEGRVRTAFGVPSTPLEVLGTTYRDCGPYESVGGGWAPSRYVLTTVGADDGLPRSVDGSLPGRPEIMLPHPDGGIIVALDIREPSETVELCGQVVRRSEGPEGPVDLVLAHIR